MGRHGPPWNDAITYFRWDAKDWIKQKTAGWTTADMNTTIETLWLLHPPIQAHYNNSRATNAAIRPGLPAPNPIPAQAYTKADLDHVERHGQLPRPPAAAAAAAAAPAAGPTPAPVPPPGGAIHAPVGTGVDVGTQAARVNTTDLLYLPDLRTVDQELPILEVSDFGEEEDEREAARKRRKRKFEDAGLCYPDKEGSTLDWRYVHTLGKGSTGTVSLWVGVDESRVIAERLAVRDVVVRPDVWINPINWRDRLPKELAVQTRLDKRRAYEHNVHRYYGHRIDFRKRRYRVFNEVYDMGDITHSLVWYSRKWRRRRNMYRWLHSQPEIRVAQEAITEFNIGDVNREENLIRAKKRAWKAFQRTKRLKKGFAVRDAASEAPLPECIIFDEYEKMSELSDWHQDELPVELPDVIPEWFLWIVFDQLVDAFTMLGSGRIDEEDDDVDWDEIVHRDGHLMNIFVKAAAGAVGKTFNPDGKCQYIQFNKEEAPSVALADFDFAFFDLQSENDLYADNPTHYILRNHPKEAPGVGGRYPPEMYWCYEGHHLDGNLSEKMTAKTDVWQVGQMMWNLVMNLPGKRGFNMEPFTHTVYGDGDSTEEVLNQGHKYDIASYKDDLFSGKTPFEASAMYSDTLKNTIIMCMDYRQHDRWSFEKLKRVTKEWAGKAPPPGSRAHGDLIIRASEEMEKFGLGKTYEGKLKRRT